MTYRRFFIGLVMLLSPFFVFADSFCASGFDPDMNGTWTSAAPEFGYYTTYQSPTGSYLVSDANGIGYWLIYPFGVNSCLFKNYDADTDLTHGTYVIADCVNGGVTGGSFASGACAGGGGGGEVGGFATTTNATSTDALLGSINFGISILIFIGLLIAMGLVYNSVNSKKPWQS